MRALTYATGTIGAAGWSIILYLNASMVAFLFQRGYASLLDAFALVGLQRVYVPLIGAMSSAIAVWACSRRLASPVATLIVAATCVLLCALVIAKPGLLQWS